MTTQDSCGYLEHPPTYQDFLDHYLLPNKPVVIGPALISSWPALSKWVSESDGSPRINWESLSRAYGDQPVTAADCSTREFSDQKRQDKTFREVVDLWRSGEGVSLYVKDWHLARAVHPEIFYETPDIFRDDWMNAYYSVCTSDDFRFVYTGAAGTFTPLHRDKRWWLFPPEQTKFLLRKGAEEHLETAFDVRHVNQADFPKFSEAKPIVVEQKDGETIFVPSGWYHQVENITECVSINHNWCNSVNLPSLYESMCAKVIEVEHALEDVRELLSQNNQSESDSHGWEHEWVKIVQDVVEKDAGWNWLTFWKMVRHAFGTALSGPLWEPAPPWLTPPLPFVYDRVRTCYDHFLRRTEREVDLVDGLRDVLDEIKRISDGVETTQGTRNDGTRGI
ncbi:Clavaminate synthase-like protein [Fomitopsis serialis]|uniref:Clavaminate synthase-like protein n=1 Tax=Fomitopsis serialis TaxID=139415 RepID=UPI0020087900|nr:Clavaminate synthase-like protein [Neoantrodia serialis]KAH9923841.1 Clavaminate synthase-like protein [Neoantrodia serialis]